LHFLFSGCRTSVGKKSARMLPEGRKRSRHRVSTALYPPDDFFGCGRGDASRIGGDVADQGVCSADATCIGLDLQRPAVIAASDMAAQREVGEDEG
jgi:hypothetical protein